MNNLIELLIGCGFITVYAYGRYNTPVTNRSTTTCGRFLGCWSLYTFVLLVIYWLFTVLAQVSPEVVSNLLSHAGVSSARSEAGLRGLRSPITTALIFTALLPNVPVLNKFDKHLLQIFWDLGEIPGHAVKLSHKLFRSTYHIQPRLLDRMKRCAENYNIDPNTLVLDQERSPWFLWSQDCALMLQLENWKDSEGVKYSRYLKRNETEFEELKTDFAVFSTRIASYQRQSKQNTGPDATEMRKDLYDHLVADGQALLKRICKFIAPGMLSIELKTEPRFLGIQKLGFESQPAESENLTSTQLVTLWGLILLSFLAVSYLQHVALHKPGQGGGIGGIIFVAILMSVNYGVSAFIGIYPKTRWRFADIQITKSRPILAYMYSGMLAIIISIIMIIALRFTNYSVQGFSYIDSFDKVVTALRWSYPYLLQSFAIGFIIAYVADNDVSHSKTVMQWKDAATVAVVFVLASLITYSAMNGVLFFGGTKDIDYQNKDPMVLTFFLAKGAIVGLLIGYLVPSWYRENKLRTPWQWVNRQVDRENDMLKIEAGKLNPGELKTALISGAAAITLADGRIDDIEKDVIKKCLGKLAEYEILDFAVSDAMKDFVEGISKWQADHEGVDVVELDGIEPLRGRPALSELLVQLCMAIGHADGVFEDAEYAVLDKMIEVLNLDRSQLSARVGFTLQPA